MGIEQGRPRRRIGARGGGRVIAEAGRAGREQGQGQAAEEGQPEDQGMDRPVRRETADAIPEAVADVGLGGDLARPEDRPAEDREHRRQEGQAGQEHQGDAHREGRAHALVQAELGQARR